MGLWDSFCGDTSLHGYQYIGRFGYHGLMIIFTDVKGRRDDRCGALLYFSA